jgi:nitroimidazol reductase NimA-like FMN-containing flavoprotein (pyridoxamine 5'-phosphate oxidase superfamily)
MLGELTNIQIDQVLQSQVVGRIGCYTSGKVYIVPVTYTFEDNSIYAHSREGMKIKMMRKNPNICFEVDEIDNMANWRSVIVWGRYEELIAEADQQKALKILMERVMPLLYSETVSHPLDRSHPPQIVEKKKKAIFYRIKIAEKTGRFEKSAR